VLQRESGRWTTTQVPAIQLPPTIQALIASRIDRLPEDERVVLEVSSVAATTSFERGVVVNLAAEEIQADVEGLLAELVRKELVRPEPDEERLAFRHQLIRDAAYASLPMQLRADLHERLAGLYERRMPRMPADTKLSEYHREQAEDYRAGRRRVEAPPPV
jgi:predicted ATPase